MTGKEEIRLGDGRTVRLRAAAPADVPRIAELYQRLSAESFRSRFHSGRPKPDLVTWLARLDPGTVALIAESPGPDGSPGSRLAAEARYVPTADGAAELALVVGDDFQGHGLGGQLLRALVDHAAGARLDRLSAVVSLANSTMLHLLARYGTALTEPADESLTVCLEISATGGMPGWPAGAAGRRLLVERRGWFADRLVLALRDDGYEVRQCAGPDRDRRCPLLTGGRCRLAEEADRIISALPAGDEAAAAVAAAHRRRWPGKLDAPAGR